MNKTVFQNMQSQLTPSAEAQTALHEKLNTIPVSKQKSAFFSRKAIAAYAGCAACAAAAAVIFSAVCLPKSAAPKRHSYNENDSFTGQSVTEAEEREIDPGNESRDELPDIDVSSLSDLTQKKGSLISDISQENTDLPISEADIPVQEEALNAYQKLMAYFEAAYGGSDLYPDWYGGSYITDDNVLMVHIAAGSGENSLSDGEFAELCLQIQAWAACDNLRFSQVTYSLNELLGLQHRILALPEIKALSFWSCGINEKTNRVELDVPEADPALLSALAKLDPQDDAIDIQVSSVVHDFGYFE